MFSFHSRVPRNYSQAVLRHFSLVLTCLACLQTPGSACVSLLSNQESGVDDLNVLVVMLESISRLTWFRHAPEIHEYITNKLGGKWGQGG